MSSTKENASALVLRSGNHLAAMAITDLQSMIGVLEKEWLTVEGVVSCLGKERDAAKIELVRVAKYLILVNRYLVLLIPSLQHLRLSTRVGR